jgi:hypothetical protein
MVVGIQVVIAITERVAEVVGTTGAADEVGRAAAVELAAATVTVVVEVLVEVLLEATA